MLRGPIVSRARGCDNYALTERAIGVSRSGAGAAAWAGSGFRLLRPLALTRIYTGVAAGELVGLQWKNVSLTRKHPRANGRLASDRGRRENRACKSLLHARLALVPRKGLEPPLPEGN